MEVLRQRMPDDHIILDPSEGEFVDYDGEDRSMARLKRTRFLDVTTGHRPNRVFSALRQAGILAPDNPTEERTEEPRLKFLGMIGHGSSFTMLSFEDINEA